MPRINLPLTRPGALVATALAAAVLALPGAALAQGKEIKIAHISSKTGPLEAYAKQTITGFKMGLDYATGGTMTVAGKKLVVIEKDDQGKPDVGKSLLAAAYADDKVDIAVGPTAVAAWRWPCCRWPRSTRRSCWSSRRWPTRSPATSGTSTSSAPAATAARTPIANAVALDKPGNAIATLAQDNAFGRDGVKAVQGVRSRRPRSCTRNTCPSAPPTSPPALQRIIDKLKDQPGRKVIWIVWAGAGNPFKIADLDLKSATASRSPPAATSCRRWWPTSSSPAWKARVLLLRHPEEPGQRVAGGQPLQAVQGAAGLLHRRRHERGDRRGRGAEEDQRRHQHRQADRRRWKA